MANIAFTASANVDIQGITPTAGPKPTVKVTSGFNSGSTAVDDYFSDTFIINPNTPATTLDLGKIATGQLVSITCDGPILVTLTQDLGAGPVDIVSKVDSFLMLESGFTGLKVANPSLTLAVNISVTVAGNRIPLGGGPGVY